MKPGYCDLQSLGVWDRTCVMFSDELLKAPSMAYAPPSGYGVFEYGQDRMERIMENQSKVHRTVKLENNVNYNELRNRK